MQSKVGEYPFTVEPFHCDFSNHLFLSSLSNDLLNASDYHSESRGYGISYLNARHRTWVLSRFAVEMNDMPVAYDKISGSSEGLWLWAKHLGDDRYRHPPAG